MDARSVCPEAARWAEMLDGRLPANEQLNLAAHLERCGRCQQTVESLTAGAGSWVLGGDPEGEPLDPTLRKAMEELKAESAAAARSAPPSAEAPLDFLSPTDQPGRLGRLGRYEVTAVVGRGGMGVVLKALDPALNRFVAVKVLAPQWAGSAAARRRFAREARAAAAVRHPNVVAIHGVDEAGGLPYLVMEYVHGVSLEQRVERDGPPELKEILRIGMQAADGLAAAHAQGLVHRDVKPANILLENGVERVKLTDFGLARAIDDASLTQSGVIAGTPLYMAPEQARGEAVDHRADLFSLGSVLYLLCTGRPAFRAPSTLAVLKRVCEDRPRPIQEITPDAPAWLVEIVEALHAKDPAFRPQSAGEVSWLLSRRLAHLQHPGATPEPPPLPRREPSAPRRGGRWGWAPQAALIVGLILAPILCCTGVPLALYWSLKPVGESGGGLQPDDPPRAVLGNPKLERGPDRALRFAVDYQLDAGAPNANLRYFWVVRSGRWKVYERPLKSSEIKVQGRLEGEASAPAVEDGPLETYLECERLIPGRLGWQRERISDVLVLRP
jgi:serine/threonine-protein kinase